MNPVDLTCRLMRSAVRFGVYTGYVQHRVVQAQYYKDPRNLQGLLIDVIGGERHSNNAERECNNIIQ